MPETPKNEKPTLSKRDNLLMALKYLMCTAGAGIIQFVSFTLLNAAAHFFVVYDCTRNALINTSRSPSMTDCILPTSTPVR